MTCKLITNFRRTSIAGKVQQLCVGVALLVAVAYPAYALVANLSHKAAEALSISSVSPNSGTTAGGTEIQISLADFTQVKDFNTTTGTAGAAQGLTTTLTGDYKIELWGAQGGGGANGGNVGGMGGYTSGTATIAAASALNFYIGGKGANGSGGTGGTGGLNGGGNGGNDTGGLDGSASAGGAGGGATDVRYGDTITNARIMVAGGGAGASYGERGGNAGGLSSENMQNTTGVNQTSGNAFFQGGNGANTTNSAILYSRGNGGGGGGWWGGRGRACTSALTCSYAEQSGSGGSSYISGHTGAVGIVSATNSAAISGCTTGTTTNSCSLHYSGLAFTSTTMIDGGGKVWTNTQGSASAMPNPAGGNFAANAGNTGAGYARITVLSTPTVTVGGSACTGVSLNASVLTCTTPAHASGAVNVVVNTGIDTTTLSNGFTYYSPTITSVSPSSGPATGGTSITITGTYLASATVKLGTTASGYSGCTIISQTSTQIQCTTTAHASGLVNVVVENGTDSISSNNAYTYTAPPTVTTVTPASGLLSGGGQITITGTNFIGVTSVTIDGNTCSTITDITATSLKCIVPAGSSVGAKNVVVTVGSSGNSGTTGDGKYTYEAPYITLASSGPVTFGVTPTGTTSVTTSGSHNVVTQTNNPTGYQLTLAMAPTGPDLGSGPTCTSSRSLFHTDTTSTIAASSNLWVSGGAGNVVLADNTWGFSLANPLTNNNYFMGVPQCSSPQIIKTTGSANESGDNTTVYYGTKIDISRKAGVYTGTVIYRAMVQP